MSACNYLEQTIGYQMPVLTQPVSEWVHRINYSALNEFAKKSIIRYGFFPVLRLQKDDTIFIKMYYYPSIVGRSLREIEDYATTFFSVNASLNYSRCDIIRIKLTKRFPHEVIHACSCMEELETILLKSLDSREFLFLNDRKESGYTTGCFRAEHLQKWTKLLEEGYLDLAYEVMCQKEEMKKKIKAHSEIIIDVTMYKKIRP